MPGKSAADRIFAAIRAVPAGQVAGYGEIARRAGLPGRARLVARVLYQNHHPKFPWHPVLRSDGRIAFPADHANFAEQSQRLRAEGVEVRDGRVRNQRAAPTLDELIWSPPPRKTKT
jgi:methylated-DNA-protein-cysteine methyltransferase-like protein